MISTNIYSQKNTTTEKLKNIFSMVRERIEENHEERRLNDGRRLMINVCMGSNLIQFHSCM